MSVSAPPYTAPDEVYRLYGFVGYHLDLEFESDETFEAISGGDLRGLTYSAHGNVLTLKPKRREHRDESCGDDQQAPLLLRVLGVRATAEPRPTAVMYAVRFSTRRRRAEMD